MRAYFFVLAVLSFILLAAPDPAISSQSSPSLVITDKQQKYYVGLYMDFLEDKQKKWTIDDVMSDEVAGKFQFFGKEFPNFQWTQSAFWFRVEIVNSSRNRRDFILQEEIPWIDIVEVYVPKPGGGYDIHRAGDTLPFKDREIKHQELLFWLTIEPGQKVPLFIKIEGQDALMAPFTLWEMTAFRKHDRFKSYYFGFVYGAFAIMLFYNLFLFLSLRDRIYLFYSLFLFSWITFGPHSNGFYYWLLWPESPWFNNIWMCSGDTFGQLCAVLFTIVFLDTKKTLPRYHKFLSRFAIFLALISINGFVGLYYQLTVTLSVVTLQVFAPILLLAGYLSYRAGNRSARFYIMAWTFSTVGGMITAMTLLNIIPYRFFLFHAYELGMVVDITLLSLALADRIYLIRKERDEAQAHVRETLESAKEELEFRVAERTADLYEEKEKVVAAQNALSRYLAPQLVENILNGREEQVEDHKRTRLTIFFSDVKDFTATTDSLEPEDLARILDEYLSCMHQIIHKYQGTLANVIGDALFIFFGAPEATDDKDHSLRCVNMAMEMQKEMKRLQEKWFDGGMENPLRIRCGINTGMATVGSYGSDMRKEYTAFGMHVNLASRLETACDPDGILISHATWALIKDDVSTKELGEIEVKGFSRPVRTYALVLDGAGASEKI